MKNGRYTNSILTVIALCLLWLSVKEYLPLRSTASMPAIKTQEAGLLGHKAAPGAPAGEIVKVLLVDQYGDSMVKSYPDKKGHIRVEIVEK